MTDDDPSMSASDEGPAVRLEVGQATSAGQVRSGNEDSVLCEPVDAPTAMERGLFCAVADGMGGHAAGEIASSMAVRATRDTYYQAKSDSLDGALRVAIETANREVFAAGSGASGREHMGTTMTAVVVFGDRAVIGQVGDSRCYLVQGDRIRQVTRDHSWVAEEVEAGVLTPEEARVHPRRNIITRALGLRPEVDVDLYEANVEPGSVLVLCSDGLHGLVRDQEIMSYVTRLPPQKAVTDLVALANERGGPDNISVVVVRVGEPNDDEADTIPGLEILDVSVRGEDITPPAGMPVVTGQPSTGEHRPAPPGEPRAPSAAPDDAPSGQVPPPLEAAPMTAQPPPPERARGPEPAAEMPAPVRPEHTAEPPARSAGMSSGMLAIILIVLLLVGAAIGWAIFRWIISPRPDSSVVAAPQPQVVRVVERTGEAISVTGAAPIMPQTG